MSAVIIISLCVLLLLAYVFDITSPHTKIPSVVLLLLSGWVVRQVVNGFDISFPSLAPLLPILGSIGLILIVLEGSLELELNRAKTKLLVRSVSSAFMPIVLMAFALALLLHYYTGAALRSCLINAVPLSVISSSVAISAGRNLGGTDREFVTYESSLSDIFGVLIFNFLVLNDSLTFTAVSTFGLQLLLVLGVSFGATLLLSYLLSRINHHIKFAPIILLVILIYEVSKVYHLPALIFILIFGLFLGNIRLFGNVGWIQRLNPQSLHAEVSRFREIVAEATFLVRASFFLLFGFLIRNEDILNTEVMVWSVITIVVIYTIRAIVLKIVGSRLNPLLFIAPRGLITILLYFAVDPRFRIDLINESLVLQVILLTSLVMIAGMVTTRRAVPMLSERHETL